MMKRQHIFAFFLITSVSVFPPVVFSAISHDPTLNWRTLTTDHFEIHFHDKEEKLAHEVAEISERVHKNLSKTFNWSPISRTQVVLSDRYDFSNGLAYPFPNNWMLIIVSPPDSFSSVGDYHSWLELLIIHEYTHVLHFDKSSGIPSTLRSVFGRFLFLFPNLLQPPWMIEGLATYEETNNPYEAGRGQNSYFRMLMRLEVENGIKPLKQVNQPLVSWPMNTVRYLYGVYFYQFIESRYGKDKIQQLVDNYSDNILPMAIGSNIKETLGIHLKSLWAEFETYLKNEFSPEIKKIKQKGLSSGKQLSFTGYFNSTPKTMPNGDVYFIQQDMQSQSRLMVIKKINGKSSAVTETRGRYFDVHPDSGIVLTELDNHKSTNIFSDLYRINPHTGKKKQITHGKRYLYASWSPDGKQIIAVHNELGEHALHLLDGNGVLLKKLWQGKDKTVIGPPDWSPRQDKIISSVWRPDTHWNLEIFNLSTNQWNKVTSSSNIETTPQFTNNGRNIVFSADYSGTFNLHKLNLDNGNVTMMSNVLGGAFSPAQAFDDNGNNQGIYFTAMAKNGFDLYYINNPPEVQADKPRKENSFIKKIQRNKINGKSLQNKTIEEYNALPRIIPTSWYPYYFATDVRNEVGINTWGTDPLYRHSYSLMAAYDTDNSWYIGRLDYLYDRWDPTIKLSLSRSAILYRDNNDDLERYRNEDSFTIEGVWPFLKQDQQWSFHAGLVHKTQTDKKVLSNFGSLRETKDDLTGIAANYNSSKRYPISISPNNGRQVKVVGEDYDFLESDHTGQVFTFDWREFIDLTSQHVLSIRGVAAWGTDTPENFRLGGTSETSVSAHPGQAIFSATERIFGQREYPLHGYPTGRNDLEGTHMILTQLSWSFPITRIERGLMSPPIGIHQLYGKLFYNCGETWDAGFKVPPLRCGAGAEVTLDLVIGYWLPLDFNIGFAKGFDTGGEDQTYIEIRASF